MTRRILVVEDSPTQAEHLRQLLQGEGYHVDVANNGRSGIERCLTELPDLVISDIVMPELDGFSLCQALKSMEATRRIPFVILTVLNTPIDVIVGLERGADNFVTKPYDDSYLLERIRRIFENLEERRQGQPEPLSIVDVGSRKIAVSSDKHQIVELLVAILEENDRLNEQLVQSQRLVEEYRSRIAWSERIREALIEERLVCCFQPILHVASRRITHHEVLLRMVDRDGGLVPPGAFLPVAEQTGLVVDIDRWVVRQAFLRVSQYQQAGEDLCLAVNLSRKTLASRDLLSTIASELAVSGASPESIMFEITETAIIQDIPLAAQVLRTIRDMGFRVALDDFGAGYGSLDYLKQLPVDEVKIDGSFIQQLPRSETDQRLVKAIVEMVHALDKEVCAEFVEDEDTLMMLLDYGVDFAQGYHIGRPQQQIQQTYR
ncbi:MAG TPA: EAL domain-containing response regulator [Symbiobacteriaceae bacterium]|nr:EAL domain-containing response regulator [Symbiobacteriaceae bacterium]